MPLDTDVLERVKTNTILEEPKEYNVIYHNDNVTTYEFVITSLIHIFHYDDDRAIDLAVKINDLGKAIVATHPHEIAEQKVSEVSFMARSNNFPLVVTCEVV